MSTTNLHMYALATPLIGAFAVMVVGRFFRRAVAPMVLGVLSLSFAAALAVFLQVLSGELKAEESRNYHQFTKLMSWADQFRRLEVWTNADTPKQAEMAVKQGAQGIGLCRTEHMFFEGERIHYVRRMILSENRSGCARV